MRAMGITLLENNSLNSGGAGAGPRLNFLNLIRDVSPKIRPLEFQPVSFLCQPTTNRLSKALHLKEGIPFFRAALATNDDGVSAKFRLVKEFLHQELVFHIIVGKLINAEKIKSTVILDARFKPFRIFSLQPQQFPAKERICNPAGTLSFLAGFRSICLSEPGFPSPRWTPR